MADRPRMFSRGGDRTSLRLLPSDVELIRAVAAVNARTVVVVQAGSAVICSEWVDSVPAVVQAWYGGCEAGPSLVDVLVGDVDPSGRLPFTVPADEADLPAFDADATEFTYDRWHGWWRAERRQLVPAFPFGFGLGYTTFALGTVAASLRDDAVEVRGEVHNTGERDGSDLVLVMAELPDPDAPARLVGFTRVAVRAGGSRPFEITVARKRFEVRNSISRSWRPASGTHTIVVGRFAGDPDAVRSTIDL